MYLFLNTLSEPTYISLFTTEREIIAEKRWEGKQREFDTLIETIDGFLGEYHISYKDLSGVIVIVGPGGFTGTRVTTLVANTLAYSFGIPLYALTVGELFSLQNTPLPWIMPVTKKEVLLWETTDSQNFSVTALSDLSEGTYTSITSIDLPSTNHTLKRADNYSIIIKNLSLSHPSDKLKPLYAKNPNITLQK